MHAQVPGQSDKPVVHGPEILHIWGATEMAPMLRAWESAFVLREPQVRFADTLKGTETAQAALFAHVAEMAAMTRPVLALERHVMFRREHHFPLELMVATGSASRADRNFALAILVHRDNPIQQLSMQDLDGIFGDQRSGAWDEKFEWHPEAARSAATNIRTWGQLGLRGDWADKPIHVYGYPVTIYSPTSGPMLSFRKSVMQGGDIWNPNLQEYPDSPAIAAAIANDKYGVGYGCACNLDASTRAMSITRSPGSSAVALTTESVANLTYPLTRSAYLSIDHVAGEPMEAGLKAFLTYILSPEGQRSVTVATGYLPLTRDLANAELKKLE